MKHKTLIASLALAGAALLNVNAAQATVYCSVTGKINASYVSSSGAYFYTIPVNTFTFPSTTYFYVTDPKMIDQFVSAQAGNEVITAYTQSASLTACPTTGTYQWIDTAYASYTYRN